MAYFNRNIFSVRDEEGTWSKEGLSINDIEKSKIPDLYCSEDFTEKQLEQKLKDMTKEHYPHEEIFGNFCHLGEYIHCPLQMAFEYAANVYSLEEWTFSIRGLKHLGGDLYKGKEFLGNNTHIYIRSDADPDLGVVDYFCAWDQGDELWMRYYFRFIDAMQTIQKPGTIVLWTNCKHPYYDRNVKDVPNHVKESRDRKDRTSWVGDIWPYFDAIHKLEMSNLKKILEYRYNHG